MPNVRRLILVSMTRRARELIILNLCRVLLTIDAQLSWSKHVDEICKNASSAIGAFKTCTTFIPADVAVQIYNALILSHFAGLLQPGLGLYEWLSE